MMSTKKQSVLARFAIVALILGTMVVYMPPFIRSFVGDDYIQFDYVKQFWLQPATILRVFNPTAVPWYYRPTQNIWFWLNRLILGWEPFGYYIILLWLHGLVIALMVRVGRQFRLGYFAAFVTAALMAIHSHWVDVVTWISSVAIVMGAIFSLLALSAMLGYLRRPSTRQLLLVFGLVLFTFLTHEEALLLPPLLLLLLFMWRWEANKPIGKLGKPKRSKRNPSRQSPISQLKAANLQSLISKPEVIIFLILFAIILLYLFIQFTRPNPTVQVSERSLEEWLAFLRWPEIAEFLLVTFFRFTFLKGVLSLTGLAASAFALGLIFLGVVWFWQGNWVIRFGLIWLAAHLFFIYWALWSQLPTLYAGRHIYQAAIGLALAIGSTIEQLLVSAKGQRGEGGTRWLDVRANQVKVGVMVVLTAVILFSIFNIRNTQQSWLKNVTEEEIARAQLFKILPDINENTHIFSYRFPIIPDFTRSVAQVWYDVPLERPGGSIKHLAGHGRADPSFIVLDYDEGQIYDLMPELRDFPETIFLWSTEADAPDLEVAGGSNGRQLAVSVSPTADGWTSVRYQIEVPENSELHTAVLAQPGIQYRLRLGSNAGQLETAFEQGSLPSGSAAEWVAVRLPLPEYASQDIEIRLEAMSDTETETRAYWANPRLVIE